MASLYLTKEWFLDAERCAREALAAQPDLLSARIVLRAVQQRRQSEVESDEEGLSPKNPCVRGTAPAANPPAGTPPASPEPATPAEPAE
ncbi:hypothetical protein [Nannocystis pusilla]|uniref:hypothetical protein n=1 Tax=Nannocystis pusilla TaxID=889268 RepID=UPI003B7B35E1